MQAQPQTESATESSHAESLYTAAQWTRYLAEQRVSATPTVLAELGQLKSTLRPMLARYRESANDARLKLPEAAPLAGIAHEAWQLTEILSRELQRASQPDVNHVCPVMVLHQLIEQLEELFERIRLQWSSLEHLTRNAEQLHEFYAKLLRDGSSEFSGPPDFAQMDRLLDRMLVRRPVQMAGQLRLLPELAISRLRRTFQSPLRAIVYTQALFTADSLMRLSQRFWQRDQDLQLLVTAALLQDCGSLALSPEIQVGRRATPSQVAMRQHPLVGAALVTASPNVPLLLGTLIAEHHERLCGSGSPRRRRGSELCEPSRLLSVIVRFEELRIQHSSASDLLGPELLADEHAVATLIQEAESDQHDRIIVSKLLSDRDPDWLESLEGLQDLTVKWRHDQQQSVASGPPNYFQRGPVVSRRPA